MTPEDIITIDVAEYIKAQYPDVEFTHVANERKTKQIRSKSGKVFTPEGNLLKRKGVRKGVSDFIIFEPRGKYHGLFLELKVETPFKKNGDLKAGSKKKQSSLMSYIGMAEEKSGLETQYEFIQKMNCRGYFATFAVGFDEAKKYLDAYLKCEL